VPVPPNSCPARVWRIDLGRPFPITTARWLSRDEMERMYRFHRHADRECFLRSRAALRHLLALETGATPESIRFRVAPTGKPLLDSPAPPESFDFSVAHTEGMALIALRSGGAVGVDVEAVPKSADSYAAIEGVLSPGELAYAAGLEEAARRALLLRAWVAREAFAKACAMGIANLDLTQVEVPVAPREVPCRLRVPAPHEHEQGWWLHWLDLGPDHAGAVVTAGSTPSPEVRDWLTEG